MSKSNKQEKEVKDRSQETPDTESSFIDSEAENSEEDFEEEAKEDTNKEDAGDPENKENASENDADKESSSEGDAPKKSDKEKTKIDELNDRIMRQMAEFENFRKRTEKEKAQMFETGARSVLEKILPVVDNFERGLAAVPAEGETDPIVEGMQMVYKQLMQELENLGVKPIEAVGKEFDPLYHNAVMQTQSEEYESGIISQELQKGYMYRESVLRHSMVAVVE